MCLGKKKQLAVININEEQMSVEKIRELPDPVRHVVMDGIFVCAALLNHYVIFNVSTGACQDLFPYEPETYPTITRISKVSSQYIQEIIEKKNSFMSAGGISIECSRRSWYVHNDRGYVL